MTARAHFLTDHLDIWSAAVTTKSASGRGKHNKLELYGLKKLRELILELAVRGLLVPQDPNDEPASVLLEKIAAEKARLIKEGKIKKQKKLAPLSEDEKPYKLPASWSWLRLTESYFSISPSGKKLKGSEIMEEGAFPVVDQGQKYIAGYTDFEELLIRIPHPVVLFGDHTTNIKYLDFDFVAGADGTKILAPVLIYPKYFYTFLRSIHIESRGYSRHFKMLNQSLIAIPPLNEQQRIVAKVDELMALCDRLEQEQERSISAHQTLVHTLLAALSSAGEQGRFDEAWARIAAHFDILFCSEESIEQLKQSILQLAVMGKLVPQNPEDEPASALLEKIAAEKTRLIKAGTIKKQKTLPPIAEDEKPFVLPDGWEWCRLGECGLFERGKSKHRPRNDNRLFESGAYPFVQTGDVAQSKKTEFLIKTCTSYYNDVGLSQSRMWPEGTLCITIAANIAETGFLTFEACFPDSVVGFISLSGKSLPKYVNEYLCASKTEIEKYAPATAQKNINLGVINQLLFPLPPLGEQDRIVAKVDELMALCDSLKERITAARGTQRHLADAMAEQAIGMEG